MRKILLLTLEFPPDRGGVARYYGGIVDAMPSDSVVVLRARLSRWIWPHWLPLLWKVFWKIYRDRISEVWVGHLLPLGTVIYVLKIVTCYMLHVTCFIHGYDLLLTERHWRKRILARRILEGANRIVTNSAYGKSLVVARGIPQAKVVIVYPCPIFIPPLSIRGGEGELRKRYHLEGKKILLTVARLVERKGVDLVLEALRYLHETKFSAMENVVYVIVGDGPERKNYELGIINYELPVLFVGAVSDNELAAWYEACDVFIMTPRKIGPDVEGFGLVYLEANAFGKPVIGSRTGGVPEAVIDGETGLLVDESDVDGIANAIQRLFSDDAFRKKLGEQGKARVEREFQWQQEVRKLLSPDLV